MNKLEIGKDYTGEFDGVEVRFTPSASRDGDTTVYGYRTNGFGVVICSTEQLTNVRRAWLVDANDYGWIDEVAR